MNVVTFETAKRLKDAGFKHSDSADNTFWYAVFNDGIFKSYHSAYGYMASIWLWDTQTPSSPPVMANPIQWEQTNEAKVFFAPTSTDILKELGYDFALKFFDDSKKFCCWQDNQDGSWQTWTDQNPAEACAAAWLSIHEKTTNQ